jgi:hypothetical protein
MRLHEIAKAIGVPAANICDFPVAGRTGEAGVIAIGDCILHLSSQSLTRSFKFLKGFTGAKRNGTSRRDVRGMDQ